MPEVCEILMTKDYLLSKIKNRLINSIEILAGKYKKGTQILKGLELATTQLPLKINNIGSKGKFLWMELISQKTNNTIYLMNTFGLTGHWSFHSNSNDRIKFILSNDDNTKKYTLLWQDQLNFGTLQFTSQLNILKDKLDDLADDYLTTDFTDDQFHDKFTKFTSKKNKGDVFLYEFLMGQTNKNGIGSGIGNYLMPEILYNAKLSPFRKLKTLSKNDIHKLAKSIKYITKLCYVNNKTGYMVQFGDYVDKHKEDIKNKKLPNYHPDIDIPDNVEFKFNVYRQKKDQLGNIVKEDLSKSERTIYWVPEIQQ